MSRVVAPLMFAVAVCIVPVGCGRAPKSALESERTEEPEVKQQAPAAPPAAGAKKEAPGGGGEGGGAGAAAPEPVSAQRHIIFTATLNVVVKDLDAATPEVEKLVAGHNGYVAKSEVKGDTGSRRTATYTLRVPAAGFKALNEGLLALGIPERNAVDSQDVTEEFVDVQARLKNLRAEEETLNKLLKESATRAEVLQTREQIRQIRGEIERAQGRLDYLSKLTTLSTVYLTLREIKDYKPPTTPTFGSRIGDTFGNSWGALVDFGQGLVLVVVALAPWAPIWVPVVVALWWARRTFRATQTDRPRRPLRAEAVAEGPVEPEAPRPPG
jgi:hypothetical protein